MARYIVMIKSIYVRPELIFSNTLFLLSAPAYLCGITGWPFAPLEEAWCTIPLMSEQTSK
jgi:hypothetical protein